MVYAPAEAPQIDLPSDSYLVLGVATCYLRHDGETIELQIIEPIPSAYLETVLNGIATSYSILWSTTLAEALADPTASLSADLSTAQPCEDFVERAQAAARSYIHRPTAKTLLPPDAPFTEVNYSTDKKRILNPKNKVSKSDNVKQHQYTHKVL